MSKFRQEIEVLYDVLSSLEDSIIGLWDMVTTKNLNSAMWRKYRLKMLKLDLIIEDGVKGSRVAFEISPRGREFLEIIRAYRSIWSSI
ncbi:unnamed protein product [marine sediment metagenome]|uniref:ArnR1-like winged helix-turn-helix domain-containing protein n=1 Tax=marine sediment metagenome TaxID=412755 RepID=X1ASH2_9ZZZZ